MNQIEELRADCDDVPMPTSNGIVAHCNNQGEKITILNVQGEMMRNKDIIKIVACNITSTNNLYGWYENER